MMATRRVFVVDDDQSVRNGLARLLRAAGHDVDTFSSTRDFLDTLAPEVHGCVVLDARLPGPRGEALWAELKMRGRQLSVIVVTADDSPETRRKAQEMGAAAFFRKPVDGTALLDAIAWAELHGRESRDGLEQEEK
jgi:FixJ family two-component response regulator